MKLYIKTIQYAEVFRSEHSNPSGALTTSMQKVDIMDKYFIALCIDETEELTTYDCIKGAAYVNEEG